MNIFWGVLHVLAYIPMFPRDISFGIQYLKINRQISGWTAKGWTIHQIFDKVAEANPQKTAIYYKDTTWTFKELQEYSLRVANYFHNKEYAIGDVVALLMENRPEYIGLWLGLSRIGVITALVNTGMKGDSLRHSVTTALENKPKRQEQNQKNPRRAFIVSKQFLPELKSLLEPRKSLPEDMQLFVMGEGKDAIQLPGVDILDIQGENTKAVAVDNDIVNKLNMASNMVYIYTSGTSGLPKAATFKFRRLTFIAVSTNIMLSIRRNDVIYNPMPLYHASGGLLGTGLMLLFGNTMVIKDKFSATAYFPDCKKYGVTVGQYIGEMCSYIYSKKPASSDKDHHVRMMFGNGMRPILWKDFQKRFNVKQIGEFYGSTEGNTNMVNINNKIGSVGFLPWFAKYVYPVELIEYEPNTGEPIRGSDGLCKRASKKGLLIGGIKNSGDGISNFEGYVDKEATDKKILKDVFKKGDFYFNSGDVLERDIFNYYYFVDRLGDTFRWKSENIAASQVESIIVKNMPELDPSKVAVYGVQVKNMEGKAGMAAFAMEDDQVNKDLLLEVAKKHMMPAQIPVFLRITSNLPQTSTNKIMKATLQAQGWNPKDIIGENGSDKMYYYNVNVNPPRYDILTPEVHDAIVNRDIKI